MISFGFTDIRRRFSMSRALVADRIVTSMGNSDSNPGEGYIV